MRPRMGIPPDERERWKARLRAWVEAEAEIAFATLFGSFLEPDLSCADIDLGLGLAPGVDPERYEIDRDAEGTAALGFPVDATSAAGSLPQRADPRISGGGRRPGLSDRSGGSRGVAGDGAPDPCLASV